jgi:hypothetical protein
MLAADWLMNATFFTCTSPTGIKFNTASGKPANRHYLGSLSEPFVLAYYFSHNPGLAA